MERRATRRASSTAPRSRSFTTIPSLATLASSRRKRCASSDRGGGAPARRARRRTRRRGRGATARPRPGAGYRARAASAGSIRRAASRISGRLSMAVTCTERHGPSAAASASRDVARPGADVEDAQQVSDPRTPSAVHERPHRADGQLGSAECRLIRRRSRRLPSRTSGSVSSPSRSSRAWASRRMLGIMQRGRMRNRSRARAVSAAMRRPIRTRPGRNPRDRGSGGVLARPRRLQRRRRGSRHPRSQRSSPAQPAARRSGRPSCGSCSSTASGRSGTATATSTRSGEPSRRQRSSLARDAGRERAASGPSPPALGSTWTATSPMPRSSRSTGPGRPRSQSSSSPIGEDAYRFDYLAQPVGGAAEGTRTAGTIRSSGEITIEQQAPAGEPICPICLARGTLIDTPGRSGPRGAPPARRPDLDAHDRRSPRRRAPSSPSDRPPRRPTTSSSASSSRTAARSRPRRAIRSPMAG